MKITFETTLTAAELAKLLGRPDEIDTTVPQEKGLPKEVRIANPTTPEQFVLEHFDQLGNGRLKDRWDAYIRKELEAERVPTMAKPPKLTTKLTK